MAAKVLDGKELAKRLGERIADEVNALKAGGIHPRIVSIQVAGDDASGYYVRNQVKQAAKVGINFDLIELPATTSGSQLAEVIHKSNGNSEITGIMLQVPLPKPLDGDRFQQMIVPHKNIEGMHTQNLGELLRGGDDLVPCTARAAVELLLDAKIEIAGKRVVVLGRSAIVGKPLALMMLHRHATVTVCHSRTKDLATVCREADIVMTAMGAQPNMVKAEWVKPGAAVVDIAIISKPEGGGITGDVEAAGVAQVAGWLAPVPGGVGPVTVMMLMRNALIAARKMAGGVA